MPFTPFHFGPHTCAALPLQRYLDLPVFVTANVIVDIEPLIVIFFEPDYPFHGYFHTFLVGGLLGVLWGAIAYPFRDHIRRAMVALRLPYSASLWKMLISGLLGVWLHVLFDAVIYPEMKPFYPLSVNPFLSILAGGTVYAICAWCFVPALVMYFVMAVRKRVPPAS